MKRNDFKIILSTLLFTYLFYQQQAGINFLIFTIISSIFLIMGNKENIKKPSVLASLAGSITAASFVYIYGTALPILSFITSFTLFIAFIFDPNSSLIIALVNGIIRILLAIPNGINNYFKSKKEGVHKSNKFTKILLLLIPIFITLIFVFLYRAANPNFLEFTNHINLDFISLPLVRFFLFALVLMYGVFTYSSIQYLLRKDIELSNQITVHSEEKHSKGWIGSRISIEYEIFIGASLLILLNILLAIVNGIDILKLWPNPVLPENQESFSQYLHSGVQMLILSIFMAIGILLFFFRGYFNSLKEAKWLKFLGFIWIIQNILLLISTVIRNNMYVEAYGLSHKRIGVFIYLLLAVIGLVITFFKLAKNKSNWFLFRKNSWAFYGVLIIATCLNWDQIITDYNLQLANNEDKQVDLEYLSKLSHVNIAELLQFIDYDTEDFYQYGDYHTEMEQEVNAKLNRFLSEMNYKNWQSSCSSKSKNLKKIHDINASSSISSIVFNIEEDSLLSLAPLSNLKYLSIKKYNSDKEWKYLIQFPNLEVLNSQGNYHTSIAELPSLSNLSAFNLGGNSISDFSYLDKTPYLIHLNISKQQVSFIKGFALLSSLKNLDISNNSFQDYSFLEKTPNLEVLNANDNDALQHIQAFPELEKLNEFSCTDCSLLSKQDNFLKLLSASKNISILTLVKNGFTNLKPFEEESGIPYFPNLKYLNLNDNYLTSISGLEKMKALQTIHLKNAKLKDFSPLASLKKLEVLNLELNITSNFSTFPLIPQLLKLNLKSCSISDLDFLALNTQITHLDLSYNSLFDMSDLSVFSALTELNLNANKIENIEALGSLKKLEILHLNFNNIEDLSPLYDLENLKKIYINIEDEDLKKILQEKLPNTTFYFGGSNASTPIYATEYSRTF